MPRHLILRLEAPLMAFGDVMIDAIGPVRDTPSASLLTGLLANALGVRREEGVRLARLQERLVFGCRLDRRGERLVDFQTAQLGATDRGWTTWARVEGRAGGDATYDSPHIRYRTFNADACVTVALRLTEETECPTLEEVARALDEPARPLFLGRKPCLPSGPLLIGTLDAPTIWDALQHALCEPPEELMVRRRGARRDASVALVLPADELCPDGFHAVRACERRDWEVGMHAGEVVTYHGQVDHRATLGQLSGGDA